ncbi:nucleoside monophosphate kinase [bacterium]|nr:nucleoside monophosphate kinase [bacterium]
MKKELIFLGPPACGKGTQTNKLSEFLGFPHIDTGSLLRAEIAKETEEGLVAKSFIDKGQLVPIDLVATIIGKKLAEEDCKNGYVLDGYPRSLEQAIKLDEINAKVDGENEVSFKAIYFDIDTQILIDRIVNRQSCPKCGEIYNKKFKPSKIENICDKCNVELKTRDDDTEEIARKRFDTYYEQTAPLIKFYEDKGVLHKIDANGSIDEVWARLIKAVEA